MRKIVVTISVLLLCLIFWTGLAVYHLIQAHQSLSQSLHTPGGYRSNIVDPKPYLRNSQVSLKETLFPLLLNPFRKDRRLVYIKRGFTVCIATFNESTLRWYLQIPKETLKARVKKKKIFDPFKLLPTPTPRKAPDEGRTPTPAEDTHGS